MAKGKRKAKANGAADQVHEELLDPPAEATADPPGPRQLEVPGTERKALSPRGCRRRPRRAA